MAAEPFALTLSAGFFGFFAHAGLVLALEERGLRPARVSGSSAGALVGGMWAGGMAAGAIVDELQRLDRAMFWDPAPGAGLLRGRRFHDRLAALLPATFAGCRVPLAVSVFDLARRRTEVLDRGPLPAALQASCTFPGLLQPVRLGGRLLIDGGVLDRPGLDGMPATSPRLFYHHIASRSPWRRQQDVARPERPGMVALQIDDLPRANPFRLDEGRRALRLAHHAARRALEAPL
ncbi:MAG: patatin, partial [Myxococcales bacterium]